ncbi:ArnT family glycosyltransferase [Lujinxingia litoralis]|nr:glycosyltransferase family 39 protein [Lujinxingia litoralis]
MARVVAALVVAMSAVLVIGSAGNLGIWEPWESGAVRLAMEVDAEAPVEEEGAEAEAAREPAATPDEGRFSGLRLWLLSSQVDAQPVVESGEIGRAERSARAPVMIMGLLLLLGVWLWTRRFLGERAGAMSAVVLATTPAMILGAIFVSGPMALMFTSSLAVLGLLAVALTSQARREASEETSGLKLSAADYGWLGMGAATLALAVWEAGVVGLALPVLTLGLVALLEWRARGGGRPVGRVLLHWPGLVWVAPALVTLVLLGQEQGFGHLLSQMAFAEDVNASGTFAWWLRQIGFGFFPWFALSFAAYGYMSWRLAGESEGDGEPVDVGSAAIARVLMLWPAVAFVVMVIGGRWGHASYAAFVPLALGVGWALSDRRYWDELRLKPQLYLLIALSVIFVVMMLGKDLERFPPRLVELVTGGQDELGLGEDYELGRALKLWKYGYVALLAAYFAGALSWLVFAWRDLKVFWAWLGRSWRTWRGKEEAPQRQEPVSEAAEVALESPGEVRAAEREAFRQGSGPLQRLAAFAEGYRGLVIVATLGALSWALLLVGVFLPDLDSNLSNRKVVASYLEVRQDDEPLLRYGFDASDSDFYVRGLESIAHARAFNARFADEERFFALIPRDRLAAVHSDVRRAHKADLVVVDNSSSTMVLVSNQLGPGEVDQSPLAGVLLDALPESASPITVENTPGESPEFNRQIALIGYELNKKGAEGQPPVYAWGEELEMTLYFETLRRVTSDQEIFVHIDTPGNRIGADHDPVGGHYPTNRWLEGDIVSDRHSLTIDRYSTPGTYTIWMGFYRGEKRMQVTPRKGQDGQNRVKVATIEIEAF